LKISTERIKGAPALSQVRQSKCFFQLNPPMAEEIHLRWMKSLCDEIRLRRDRKVLMRGLGQRPNSFPLHTKIRREDKQQNPSAEAEI
jgi:hypothetical protein